MLLRLLALGTLGYVAFRYLKANEGAPPLATPAVPGVRADIPLAGGPLSSLATVQHSADEPPSSAPATQLP